MLDDIARPWKEQGKPLDSKDRKPARPSLFETGPAPAAAQGTRVPLETGLAGPAKLRGWRRTWPWVLVVGLAVAGLVGWMTLPDGSASAPRQVAHVPTATPGDLQAGQASTAVLVDGGSPRPTEAPSVDDPMSIIRANAETGTGSGDADAGPQTDLASRFGLGSSTPATERRTSVASRRTSTARPRASTSSEKADLLAVLMANIREQPQDKANSAPPPTMDALIAQLSQAPPAESASNPAGGAAAASSDQSSANLQRQLRSCPAANTTAGIRCRQRLCAKHAGDPACPKQ